MKKKIAILGATYLQQPLVEKANAMGIETYCFAWDNEFAVCKQIADNFYPISILDKKKILTYCKRIEIDGITTIATDICIPTISFVAQKLNLISNTFETSILATNKFEMRKCLKKANMFVPNFIALKTFDFKKIKHLNFPLIIKPTDRSGSRGISKVKNYDELKIAFEVALNESIERKIIVEEFIEGVEVSVESISWKGNHHILTITDKVTTNEPHFVELEHHQPSQLEMSLQKKIIKETKNALNALGINYGAGHTEIKIDSKKNIYIIEIGARMGGDFIGSHLVKLSTGYDFLEGVINVSLNKFTKPTITNNKYAGVYFLSKETQYLQSFFLKNNTFEIEKKILSHKLKSITNSNDRSGYLIYCDSKKIILK